MQLISDSSAGYRSIDLPFVFICSALKPISVRFILGFVLSVVQETLMVSYFFGLVFRVQGD